MGKHCGWLMVASLAAGLMGGTLWAEETPRNAAPKTKCEKPDGPRGKRKLSPEEMEKIRAQRLAAVQEKFAKKQEEKANFQKLQAAAAEKFVAGLKDDGAEALNAEVSAQFKNYPQYAKQIFAAYRDALKAAGKTALSDGLKDAYIKFWEDNSLEGKMDRLAAIVADQNLTPEQKEKAIKELGMFPGKMGNMGHKRFNGNRGPHGAHGHHGGHGPQGRPETPPAPRG